MFAGCTSITTVTIPKSIETIGTSAFDGCSKLATLTLGTGVTTLGDRAFADCGLTALALPDNVTTLGDGAFSNNPNIATLNSVQASPPSATMLSQQTTRSRA